MGKIYAAPKSIKVPNFANGIDEYRKDCERYRNEIQKLAKDNGKGKYAGKIVSFPHADGYASYAVVSLSPVTLIHLADGDAYEFPYIHRMTASDIREKIDADERWATFIKNKRTLKK